MIMLEIIGAVVIAGFVALGVFAWLTRQERRRSDDNELAELLAERMLKRRERQSDDDATDRG